MSPDMLAALANSPAGVPPPGISPNFDNPPSKDQELLVLNVVFLPLMLLAVVMRLLVKGKFIHQFGWDDSTCALAAVSSVVHSAVILNSIHIGMGRHIWDIRASTLLNVDNMRQLDSIPIVYPITTYFIKLSILLLYRRVFLVDRIQRWGSVIGIVLITITHLPYLGFQIYLAVRCAAEAVEEVTSMSPFILDAICKNMYWIGTTQSAINVISDFYILLLPLPALLKLAMPTRRKVGLCAIFLAGLVACIVSVVRLILMAKTLGFSRANKGDDYTWESAMTIELSVVEVNVAIICACMTTMPTFVARSKLFGLHILNSFRTRYENASRKQGYGNFSHSGHSGNDQEPLSQLSPISISKSYVVSCTPIHGDKAGTSLESGKGAGGGNMW